MHPPPESQLHRKGPRAQKRSAKPISRQNYSSAFAGGMCPGQEPQEPGAPSWEPRPGLGSDPADACSVSSRSRDP